MGSKSENQLRNGNGEEGIRFWNKSSPSLVLSATAGEFTATRAGSNANVNRFLDISGVETLYINAKKDATASFVTTVYVLAYLDGTLTDMASTPSGWTKSATGTYNYALTTSYADKAFQTDGDIDKVQIQVSLVTADGTANFKEVMLVKGSYTLAQLQALGYVSYDPVDLLTCPNNAGTSTVSDTLEQDAQGRIMFTPYVQRNAGYLGYGSPEVDPTTFWDAAASAFTPGNVTINNGGGYATTTTSMTVLALPFTLKVGTKLTFTGGGEYIITTQANAGATTIVSTSGLTGAAVADTETAPSGTYSWTQYGANTIANVSSAIEIAYVSGSAGAFTLLKDSEDLSADIVVGKRYRVTCDAKYAGGSAGVRLDLTSTYSSALTTSMVNYSIDYIATSASGDFLRLNGMAAGNVVTIDNLSIYSLNIQENLSPVPVDYTPYVIKGNLNQLAEVGQNHQVSSDGMLVYTTHYLGLGASLENIKSVISMKADKTELTPEYRVKVILPILASGGETVFLFTDFQAVDPGFPGFIQDAVIKSAVYGDTDLTAVAYNTALVVMASGDSADDIECTFIIGSAKQSVTVDKSA
jgi:hypothetical protein